MTQDDSLVQSDNNVAPWAALRYGTEPEMVESTSLPALAKAVTTAVVKRKRKKYKKRSPQVRSGTKTLD